MTGEKRLRLPQSVKNNIQKGRRLQRAMGGDCPEPLAALVEGVLKDEGITLETVKSMGHYLNGYDEYPDLSKSLPEELSPSDVGWLLYGGKAGKQWCNRVLKANHPSPSFSVGGSVVKVDDTLGLVMGYAIISTREGEPYFDSQGDHIPEASMLEASVDFMKNSRVAKEMHQGEEKGSVLFAWPLTEEIAKAFGIQTSTTGLMIAMLPDNEEVLEKFKSGEYTGFSIGGSRIEDEEVEDNG